MRNSISDRKITKRFICIFQERKQGRHEVDIIHNKADPKKIEVIKNLYNKSQEFEVGNIT